ARARAAGAARASGHRGDEDCGGEPPGGEHAGSPFGAGTRQYREVAQGPQAPSRDAAASAGSDHGTLRHTSPFSSPTYTPPFQAVRSRLRDEQVTVTMTENDAKLSGGARTTRACTSSSASAEPQPAWAP